MEPRRGGGRRAGAENVRPLARPRLGAVLALLPAILAGAGCRTAGGTDYVHRQADFDAIQRVAVLPFDNQTQEAHAGERLTHVFMIEMMARSRWEVVDLAQVRDALAQAQVASPSQMSAEAIRRIGELTQTQALLVGSVDVYEMEHEADVAYPVVAISARLVDVQTGSVLWAGHMSGHGKSMTPIVNVGTVDTLPEMSQIVCQNLVRMMVR